MPYIKQTERQKFKKLIDEFTDNFIGEPGELNYVITMLCKATLGKHPHYSDFNQVIGVLECAKLELYRRLAAPYEDLKVQENGDV